MPRSRRLGEVRKKYGRSQVWMGGNNHSDIRTNGENCKVCKDHAEDVQDHEAPVGGHALWPVRRELLAKDDRVVGEAEVCVQVGRGEIVPVVDILVVEKLFDGRVRVVAVRVVRSVCGLGGGRCRGRGRRRYGR